MVKPRENRVPMMLSDSELSAIDTWRFDNRVATRSEAIRRLVRIGLLYDEQASGLRRSATSAFEQTTAFSLAFIDFLSSLEHRIPKDASMMKAFLDLQPHVAGLMMKSNALFAVSEQLKRGDTVEGAIIDAATERAEVDKMTADLKTKLDDIKNFGRPA